MQCCSGSGLGMFVWMKQLWWIKDEGLRNAYVMLCLDSQTMNSALKS